MNMINRDRDHPADTKETKATPPLFDLQSIIKSLESFQSVPAHQKLVNGILDKMKIINTLTTNDVNNFIDLLLSESEKETLKNTFVTASSLSLSQTLYQLACTIEKDLELIAISFPKTVDNTQLTKTQLELMALYIGPKGNKYTDGGEGGCFTETILDATEINHGVKVLYLTRAITFNCDDFILALDKLYDPSIKEEKAKFTHLQLIQAFKNINNICFNNEAKVGDAGIRKALEHCFKGTMNTLLHPPLFTINAKAMIGTIIKNILLDNEVIIENQVNDRIKQEEKMIPNKNWRTLVDMPLNQINVLSRPIPSITLFPEKINWRNLSNSRMINGPHESIIFGGYTTDITVVNRKTNSVIKRFSHLGKNTGRMLLLGNRRLAVASSGTGEDIRIFSLHTGKLLHRIPNQNELTDNLVEVGNLIVESDQCLDSMMRVYDSSTGTLVGKFKLALAPNRLVATGQNVIMVGRLCSNNQPAIVIYDPKTGEMAKQFPLNGVGKHSGIQCMILLSNGNLAIVDTTNQIHIHNPDSGKLILTFTSTGNNINNIVGISEVDGNLLLGDSIGCMNVHNRDTGKLVQFYNTQVKCFGESCTLNYVYEEIISQQQQTISPKPKG